MTEDDDGQLDEGTLIGDYLLEEQLGQGPFSEVWSGWHTEDDEEQFPVAIKIATHPLYTQWMADAQTFALTIDHPNILLASEIDFSQLPPYLVYDRIDGDSLGELIDMDLQFNQRGVLALVRQVTAGIAALHEAGEFHGALKPRNVMLAETGEVVILDTETARITRDIALLVRRGGMAPDELEHLLPYLAPEDLAQPGRTDPRADVFSIGCLYYALLTLESPREGGPTEEDLEDQPAIVASLILECVAPLESRIADGSELLARLDRLAGMLPLPETDGAEYEDEEYEEDGEEYEEDEDDDEDDDDDAEEAPRPAAAPVAEPAEEYEEFIGLDSDEFAAADD